MGVALFLIGILAVLAGVVLFVWALVRKSGWGVARSLALGGVGVVLVMVGIVIGIVEETEQPETPTSTPKSIEVIKHEGFTISLVDYYWEEDKFVTEFSFFNDRSQKNEFIDVYAYDQDENRISGESGTWPMGVSVPILWPGETKENTITWRGGPRSNVITITFRFGEWPTYTKKSFIITREQQKQEGG